MSLHSYRYTFDVDQIMTDDIVRLKNVFEDFEFLRTYVKVITARKQFLWFSIITASYSTLPDYCNALFRLRPMYNYGEYWQEVELTPIANRVSDLIDIYLSNSARQFNGDKLMFDAVDYLNNSSHEIKHIVNEYQVYISEKSV